MCLLSMSLSHCLCGRLRWNSLLLSWSSSINPIYIIMLIIISQCLAENEATLHFLLAFNEN